MKSILWTVCLLALTYPSTKLSAQVNPYKDGTPGVTGYRSEVLAEVMIQEDKFVRLPRPYPPTNTRGVRRPMCAPSPKYFCM
jgi:hypothetical protein